MAASSACSRGLLSRRNLMRAYVRLSARAAKGEGSPPGIPRHARHARSAEILRTLLFRTCGRGMGLWGGKSATHLAGTAEGVYLSSADRGDCSADRIPARRVGEPALSLQLTAGPIFRLHREGFDVVALSRTITLRSGPQTRNRSASRAIAFGRSKGVTAEALRLLPYW